MKFILFAIRVLCLFPSQCNSLSISSAASSATSLKDYSGVASGLFNNMRTPAALIGGAIVPLGILTAPAIEKEESKRMKFLKNLNMLLAVASLLSEILAITYSTIAINKLAEIKFAPTADVSELISKYFETAWIGTNVHFLLGMFGFGLLVGTKAFFAYGTKVGKIACSWSIAAFLQCCSIVNGGISMGSGDIDHTGSRYGVNIFSLISRYIKLIFLKAKDAQLPKLVIILMLYSAYITSKFALDALMLSKEKEE